VVEKSVVDRLGAPVGDKVGFAVCEMTETTAADNVGFAVGVAVGDKVGFAVGDNVRIALGGKVGFAVGGNDGFADGEMVGFAVDEKVGFAVSEKNGFAVGTTVGERVDGISDGLVVVSVTETPEKLNNVGTGVGAATVEFVTVTVTGSSVGAEDTNSTSAQHRCICRSETPAQ
jgi:hypothetical protein